jgi:hypothetical protein
MFDIIAVILLGLGVMGGASLALLHLLRKHVPLWAGFLHGAAVGPGVILVFFSVAMEHGFQSVMGWALLLFLLAAPMGAVLFWHHAKRKPLPRWLILLHGPTALTGYIVLLFATL